MKLIQTDFKEHSLVMVPRTKNLIIKIIESMLDSKCGSVELRDEANALWEFLAISEIQDSPTLFQKTCTLNKCLDCAGSGQQKTYPKDRNDDILFLSCPRCQGSGQLYMETIRKGYVPTEAHRRKFAK